MRPPIINLSFNACGTAALHGFIQANGVRARHHGGHGPAKNLACTLYRNAALQRPPLTNLESWEAFGDFGYVHQTMVLEANQLYAYLHAHHGDAYFLFVDRDVDDWIASRARRTEYLQRYTRFCDIGSEADTRALWRRQYTATRGAMVRYFGQTGARFLLHDYATGRVEDICAFLAPDYDLDPRLWTGLTGQADPQPAMSDTAA